MENDNTLNHEDLIDRVKALWEQIKTIVTEIVNKIIQTFKRIEEKQNGRQATNTKSWLDKKHNIRMIKRMKRK